jgi:hypothetical protein
MNPMSLYLILAPSRLLIPALNPLKDRENDIQTLRGVTLGLVQFIS